MIDTEVHIGRFLNDTWDESHLASLWDAGVTEAWCSSLSSGTVGMQFGNAEMAATLKREKRLRGLVWVVPYDPDWKRLASDYLQSGFIGLKIHPPLDRWEPTEAFLGPVLELAGEFGVPVFTHAHELNLIGSFIGKYPAVQLVVYHLGGFDGIWLAKRNPNVWPGLSWCDAYKITTAIGALGSQRLLYGTDSPIRLVKNPVVEMQGGQYRTYPQMLLAALDMAEISAESKAAICSQNALRLLEVARAGANTQTKS